VAKKKLEPTEKQRRLCETIVAQKEINHRQAYESVYAARGKTADVEVSRTLKLPHVAAYLKKLQEDVAIRAEIDATKVVKELGKVAFTNIKEYVNVDSEGNITFIPFNKVEEDKLAAIESIKVRVNVTENTRLETQHTTTTIEFKLHNKLNALEQLGRHFGIYQKDNEQGPPIELKDTLTLEEVKKRIKQAEKAGNGIDYRSIKGGCSG